MGQTLSRVVVHVVFSTKDRRPWLKAPLRPPLFAYIAGIVRHFGGTPLAMNGVADHVHLLFSLPRTLTIAAALRTIKAKSSAWMRPFVRSFSWQAGYAAFSVSHSHVLAVKHYIEDQEHHHKRVPFESELLSLLKKHEIEYDETHLWS